MILSGTQNLLPIVGYIVRNIFVHVTCRVSIRKLILILLEFVFESSPTANVIAKCLAMKRESFMTQRTVFCHIFHYNTENEIPVNEIKQYNCQL